MIGLLILYLFSVNAFDYIFTAWVFDYDTSRFLKEGNWIARNILKLKRWRPLLFGYKIVLGVVVMLLFDWMLFESPILFFISDIVVSAFMTYVVINNYKLYKRFKRRV